MINIRLVSVLVNDQQKALDFYTKKVGSVVKQDIPMGEFSWLTVGHPDEQMEISLEPNQLPSAKALQDDLYDKGIPWTALMTDNVDAEYERMNALGVKFKSNPQEMGGVKVVSFDDTCGNWIQLYQQ
jgi:predicted enzyme related to lactoylglutathione lyase